MGKLILLLLLGLLACLAYKDFRRRSSRSDERVPPPMMPERMVACARCGLHLPVSETIEEAGRHFCCEDHRRLGIG